MDEKNVVNFGAAEIDTNHISAVVWKAANDQVPVHVVVVLNGSQINLVGDSYNKFVAWHAQQPPSQQIELPAPPAPVAAVGPPVPVPSPASPPASPPVPGVPSALPATPTSPPPAAPAKPTP